MLDRTKVTWAALAVSAAVLAACGGSSSPYRSQASSPTVSYSYQDGSDFDEVQEQAEDYCDEEFDRDAVLLSRDGEGERMEATFSCQ